MAPAMTEKEREFIKERSLDWARALAAASLSVRANNKLVGADRIRGPLAERAALKALGCPGVNRFELPASAGPVTPPFLEIIQAVFADAVASAQAVLR